MIIVGALTYEKLKEIADRYGIEVSQAGEGERGGFFLAQPDGSKREMTVDELMENVLPGSMKLVSKPNGLEAVKSAMKKEVSDYRDAVSDDEEYCQGEADEELKHSLERRLHRANIAIVSKRDGHLIADLSLETVWRVAQNVGAAEDRLIVWDDVSVPAPLSEIDVERFGDFISYIAKQYGIPYQL